MHFRRQAFWCHSLSNSFPLLSGVFLVFNREMGAVHGQAQWEVLSLFVPQGSRSSGTYRMADYHSVEELGSCSLMGQQEYSCGGLGGHCWASVLCWEGSLLAPAE
jgi:hypothetical protein